MKRFVSALVGCLLLALVPACAGTRLEAPTARPSHGAPPISYYEAGGEVPEATSKELLHQDHHIDIRRFRIPARVPESLRDHTHATDEIEIVLFRPRPLGGTPRATVLVSPVLANSFLLVGDFARAVVRTGYNAAIVMRKDFEIEDDTVIEDAETEFRLLVMRSKQAMDWLAARDDVDGTRFATFGVSAGAIVSSCLAGTDERIRANVLILAGGPLSDVLIDTDEDRFEGYAQDMPGPKMTKEEIRKELRRVLRTDPINLASRVRTENVFMILAKYDTSVPTRNGLMLWNALGRPRMVMLPLGHYNAFLTFFWMAAQSNAFLHSRLGPP